MSKKQLRDLIQKEMPGYQIVDEKPASDRVARVAPDATSPSLEELRRKYLGEPADLEGADAAAPYGGGGAGAATADNPDDDDITVVLVEPSSADARAHGAGPKAIVVSKDGKIVGTQG